MFFSLSPIYLNHAGKGPVKRSGYKICGKLLSASGFDTDVVFGFQQPVNVCVSVAPAAKLD